MIGSEIGVVVAVESMMNKKMRMRQSCERGVRAVERGVHRSALVSERLDPWEVLFVK